MPGSMGKLVVLMVTAFVDMVGMLMILPLLPFYAKSLGATGFTVGLLVSSFAIAQLLAAPGWATCAGFFTDDCGACDTEVRVVLRRSAKSAEITRFLNWHRGCDW